MDALDLVKLAELMELTSGHPDIIIALIDGPLVTDHPSLTTERIRLLPDKVNGSCVPSKGAACRHVSTQAFNTMFAWIQLLRSLWKLSSGSLRRNRVAMTCA